MNKKQWKILALVSISLLVLVLVSVSLIVSSGFKQINNEETCAYDICGNSIYQSYNYDMISKNCYCYEYGSDVANKAVNMGDN